MTITEAIDSFLADCGIRRSPATVHAYRGGLARFGDYLSADGRPPERTDATILTCKDPVQFVRWLTPLGLSRSTLATYLAAVARFYRWLMLEEVATWPAADYARLQERLSDLRGGRADGRALPKIPDETGVQSVLALARERVTDQETTRVKLLRLRDAAIVETLRSTGCRISEAAGLRRKDLDESKRAAKVLGKGRKERLVYFDRAAWSAVWAYLVERDRAALVWAGNGRGEPLFARHDRAISNRLSGATAQVLRRAVTSLSERAALDERIRPHQLRHRFATRMLQATHDLAATQKALGHAGPGVTAVYLHLTNEDVEDAHAKFAAAGG